jgi:hypothetical protein
MAVPVWATNDVPTATDFNVWLTNVISAVKTATESLTSNTTLQDDDELIVTVAANSTYELTCMLRYDAATAGDLQFKFVGPAGATGTITCNRFNVGAASTGDDTVSSDPIGNVVTAGGLGAGFDTPVAATGLLKVAGTAGTFKLQWAQNTSSGTATRIFADSFIVLRRIL